MRSCMLTKQISFSLQLACFTQRLSATSNETSCPDRKWIWLIMKNEIFFKVVFFSRVHRWRCYLWKFPSMLFKPMAQERILCVLEHFAIIMFWVLDSLSSAEISPKNGKTYKTVCYFVFNCQEMDSWVQIWHYISWRIATCRTAKNSNHWWKYQRIPNIIMNRKTLSSGLEEWHDLQWTLRSFACYYEENP